MSQLSDEELSLRALKSLLLIPKELSDEELSSRALKSLLLIP